MPGKKAAELIRIRAFLKYLGYKFKSIKRWEPDPPDAVATIKLSDWNKWQSIGIEETRHFSGAKLGYKSQDQALYDFWELTRKNITRRIAKRKDVENIYGYVTLNKTALLADDSKMRNKKQRDYLARSIAKELIDLALEFSNIVGSKGIDLVCGMPRHSSQLQVPLSYTILNKYMWEIKLVKKEDFGSINKNKWNAYVNAAYIGVSAKYLIEIIIQKANGLKKWSCGNIAERWLLITAPATTVHDSMHSHPELVKWEDPNLISQCKSSGFDKIFFWSCKPPEWCKQIWPQSQSISAFVR